MAAAWANAVGVAAAVCSMTSFLPQIVKIVRERDAASVSLRMYVVMVIGFGCWIAYGAMITSWPIAASNIINLALSATVLGLKWRFGEAKH